MPDPRRGTVIACGCCLGAGGVEPRPDGKFATDASHKLTYQDPVHGYACGFHAEILRARERCMEGKN